MDALELLKQDHQKVKELFKQQSGDKKQQRQFFKEIKSELETHARIEETISILQCNNTTNKRHGA